LLADAAVFYASIPADMPREQVLLRAQAFLAGESSILTLSLLEGTDGQPVGLGLRADFWSNIVAPEAVKAQWRNDTTLLVAQVLVATGINVPTSWSSPAAAPLVAHLLDALPAQQPTAPWTASLRTLEQAFTPKDNFHWPPKATPQSAAPTNR
jgi:hypothetical protein